MKATFEQFIGVGDFYHLPDELLIKTLETAHPAWKIKEIARVCDHDRLIKVVVEPVVPDEIVGLAQTIATRWSEALRDLVDAVDGYNRFPAAGAVEIVGGVPRVFYCPDNGTIVIDAREYRRTREISVQQAELVLRLLDTFRLEEHDEPEDDEDNGDGEYPDPYDDPDW